VFAPKLKSLASTVAEILRKLRNFKVVRVPEINLLLTYFCIAYFLLLTSYLCAKHESYTFSHFRVIHTGPKIEYVAT